MKTTGNKAADKMLVSIAREGGLFVCRTDRLGALLAIIGGHVDVWDRARGGKFVALTDNAALLADQIRNQRTFI